MRHWALVGFACAVALPSALHADASVPGGRKRVAPTGKFTVPKVIAEGQDDVGPLAVDADSVYWATGGSIMRRPKAGGPLTSVVFPAWARTLALDSDSIYFTTSAGDVMKAPKDGGSPVTLASEQLEPQFLAADGDAVYWVNHGAGLPQRGDYSSGSVMKVAKSGGKPLALAVDQLLPSGLAVSGSSVYFVADGKLRSLPTMGGKLRTLSGKGFTGAHVVVAGANVFMDRIAWRKVHGGVMQDHLEIVMIPLAGGAETVIAKESLDDIDGFAADETGVYWVAMTNGDYLGTVRRVPISGGPRETLAERISWPGALALDSKSLYFTSTSPDYDEHGRPFGAMMERREHGRLMALPK